jgi:hypothetical protein
MMTLVAVFAFVVAGAVLIASVVAARASRLQAVYRRLAAQYGGESTSAGALDAPTARFAQRDATVQVSVIRPSGFLGPRATQVVVRQRPPADIVQERLGEFSRIDAAAQKPRPPFSSAWPVSSYRNRLGIVSRGLPHFIRVNGETTGQPILGPGHADVTQAALFVDARSRCLPGCDGAAGCLLPCPPCRRGGTPTPWRCAGSSGRRRCAATASPSRCRTRGRPASLRPENPSAVRLLGLLLVAPSALITSWTESQRACCSLGSCTEGEFGFVVDLGDQLPSVPTNSRFPAAGGAPRPCFANR